MITIIINIEEKRKSIGGFNHQDFIQIIFLPNQKSLNQANDISMHVFM